MTGTPDNPPSTREPEPDSGIDVTGRDRMAWNVMASWVGHFAILALGLILPLLIDRRINQTAYGVWAFTWSLTNYLNLVQLGVTASVGRFVAKHRAAGDTDGINGVVNSATCIFLVVGAVVLSLTVAASFTIPHLFRDKLGAYAEDAQWVMFFLGMSLVVQIVCSGFGGIMTGFHRWDLHNGLNVLSRFVGVSGGAVVLLLGKGLLYVALMNLCGEVVGRVTRCLLAYRVYPQLEFRFAYVSWSMARRLLTFGGKTFIFTMSNLLMNETSSILLVGYREAGALAPYAIPKSLCRHATIFVVKFSRVLTPSASSLQALSRPEELRDLLIKGARYAAYMTLPMILFLVIMGDPILVTWMGPRYQKGVILAILAIALVSEIHRPCLSVMAGMNAHAPAAVANLIAAVCCVGLTVWVLGPLDKGLVAVAVVYVVPFGIANGLFLPIYACHRIGISVGQYFLGTLVRPVLCVIPFALSLLLCRVVFRDRPRWALVTGVLAGGAVIGPIYWKRVLPASLKIAVLRRLGMARGADLSAEE